MGVYQGTDDGAPSPIQSYNDFRNDYFLTAHPTYRNQDNGARLQTAFWQANGGAPQRTAFDCAHILNTFVEDHAVGGLPDAMLALAVVDTGGLPGRPVQEHTVFWTNSGPFQDLNQNAWTAPQRQAAADILDLRVGGWIGLTQAQLYTAGKQCRDADRELQQQPGGFCFASHPYSTYRYARQVIRGSPSYDFFPIDLNRPGYRAPPTICNCAGTKLAGHLKALNVFARPAQGAAGDVQRGMNRRVKCFAERLSVKRGNVYEVNPPSEQGPPVTVSVLRVAHSCNTCQVLIQKMWGNPVIANGNGQCGSAPQAPSATQGDLIAAIEAAVVPDPPPNQTQPFPDADLLVQAMWNHAGFQTRRNAAANGQLIGANHIDTMMRPDILNALNAIIPALPHHAYDDAIATAVIGVFRRNVQARWPVRWARVEGREAARNNVAIRMSLFERRRPEHLWGCPGSHADCSVEPEPQPVCMQPSVVTVELVEDGESKDEGSQRGCIGDECYNTIKQRKFAQQTCAMVKSISNRLECDFVERSHSPEADGLRHAD